MAFKNFLIRQISMLVILTSSYRTWTSIWIIVNKETGYNYYVFVRNICTSNKVIYKYLIKKLRSNHSIEFATFTTTSTSLFYGARKHEWWWTNIKLTKVKSHILLIYYCLLFRVWYCSRLHNLINFFSVELFFDADKHALILDS